MSTELINHGALPEMEFENFKNMKRLRIDEGITEMTGAEYQLLISGENVLNERELKYKNKINECNGIKFRSIKEKNVYLDLCWRRDQKQIKDFNIQVPFVILDAVGDFIERKYIADFVVINNDWTETVIDAKGVRTELYKLKKHLMFLKHGILIKEL